jgi:CheY-like chemotaxis protein
VDDAPDDPARVGPVTDETIRAQKLDAVARLVPGIAHELNNPLAAIVGFAELLRTDPRLPDDMRKQAELLAGETARTRQLVHALLDFLRERPPERHPNSVRGLVDAALALHAYRLASSPLEVRIQIPDDLPPMEIDRARIQLVLVNLLQEAFDVLAAGTTPGQLGIAAVSRGGAVRLTISLDGPDATSEPDRELAWQVSDALVAGHGGTLVREPGPRGVGTTLAVTLPATGAAHAMATGEAVSPTDAALHRKRVLVLDDEPPIAMLLEKWLRGSGYEPTVVTSGEHAVELVRETPFDAVLCDHRMAGMSGTEVFEALVDVRPELEGRFVFMSGDVFNPELREFVEQRGIGLLAKPFDRDTVRRTVESILGATTPGAG